MAFGKFLKRVRSDKRGSALIITALSMPVMIGAAGLAVDTVQWTLWKRQAQRAADSAALAGAYAVGQTKSADTAARADLVKTADLAYSVTPTVENAPTAGSHTGDAQAVRVILRTSRRLPFSSLFISTPPVIYAEATAAIITSGPHCLISLESGSTPGIIMAGNATATLGCGVATNSRAANAIQAGGSSALTASPITAVGGIDPSASYLGGAKLEAYSLVQADPFAGLSNPTLPATCNNSLNVNPQGSVTLTPDPTNGVCYRGMDIKGDLHLNPGVYYIDGGTFDVGAQAHITGTGVTIVLTSSTAATSPSSIATININAGAELDLTAPTTGQYAGVLMYQDRRALPATNQINGNANSLIQGAMYFPKQDVLYNGTSGMHTECVQIVSRRITMSGNSSISNSCPPNPNQPNFVGSRVRLVG